MNIWRLLAATLCLSLSLAYAAERSIIVMPLNHSLPEQVLPAIQTLLPAEATATAHGNQLILKVTPQELVSIEQLLKQIDKPARQLLISIRTPHTQTDSESSISASGSFANGTVQIGSDSNAAKVVIRSRDAENTKNEQQSVRATEGMPAYIAIGESIPVTSHYRDGQGRRETVTEYKQADKGFYVTARLAGETVVVDINQTNDQHQQNQIATKHLSTQVSGPLGQWITIGNTDVNSTTSQSGLVVRSSDAGQRSDSIQLKVEELQ